jgi:glycosyltransferase involved in cell wall biosynthesis
MIAGPGGLITSRNKREAGKARVGDMVSVARRPVTVCQLLHTLQVGGAEMLAARLAHGLGQEFRFVFACLDGLGTLGEELRREGHEVHVLARSPGLDWRCACRLGALLRRERVDLVHAHQYTPFFYALMGRWLCRRPPILFTEHGRHQPDYPRRKRMLANRLLLEKRDRVIGVGRAVRDALIANEGISPERVSVLYNGVDLKPFAVAADRNAARREMGVGPEHLVLIQVARLDYLKDHLTAIRTVERLVARRPEVRLVLVGEGPERKPIEREVRQRGLTEQIRLLGLRKDVARLVSAADVFLLTSVSEGIPLTLIEAMGAGLPVVSTDAGGVPEVVMDGRTGLLAPVKDDARLAEHCLRLAADPGLRAEMGGKGRRRAEELFAESQMHAGYRRLYEEMLCG